MRQSSGGMMMWLGWEIVHHQPHVALQKEKLKIKKGRRSADREARVICNS